MNIRNQNGELLGMTGRGTLGGEQRVDQSDMEPGIHMRWQMAPELGFPPKGFDLYRRSENYRKYIRCGAFIETDLGGIAWGSFNPDLLDADLKITASGNTRTVKGCDRSPKISAAFPGTQEVRFEFSEPVRYVRILFDERTEENPVAEAYWQSKDGDVLLVRKNSRRKDDTVKITLFADHIDHVLLTGEDMIICTVCFVTVQDGYDDGWPKTSLNGKTRIFLPITHDDWISPHDHAPNDKAEANARLPSGLPFEKRREYMEGFDVDFDEDLHGILYDLVGTEAQHLYRLKETDPDSGSSIDWPGMNLLQLMAIDPNIARILGLYWHDDPPSPNVFYDYRIVAHYSKTPLPGKRISYSDLEPGIRIGSLYNADGISYVSPNPIDVVKAIWDGSEHTALLFTHSILFGPISINLPDMFTSITLRLSAEESVSVKVFQNHNEVETVDHPAGEHTLNFEDNDGFNKIAIYPLGEITLFEMVLRKSTDVIGDLQYDIYHLRSNSSTAVPVPDLELPIAEPSTTGVDENGIFMQNQNRVALRWDLLEAGGPYLKSGAPVLFQVQREGLNEGGDQVLESAILNETSPSLVGSTGQPHYSDQNVPDGLYTYAVRGIDIFGVMGDWGKPKRVDVLDQLAPPPPQSVQAFYLDPADPWLSEEDKAWVDANGSGLRLSWVWPGTFRLQAPDVNPPDAEFRVYGTIGALNELRGQVTQVMVNGATTELTTDMDIRGSQDDLADESIRVNQHFFSIVSNTTGANSTIVVDNLTRPDLAPTPGPCTITFSQEHNYWRDYRKTKNWQRRLHVKLAEAITTVAGQVTAVEDLTDETLEQPVVGHIVTLDQPMPDDTGLAFPGALMCNGVLYRVSAHTQGATIRLEIAPVLNPTNGLELIRPVSGDTCEYFPGKQYEIRIPGFDVPVPANEATGMAHVAMSCSDGKPHADDNPLWSRPRRGQLGGRPGNEGVLSPPVRVMAVHRMEPATVANVPEAPPDPIYAKPANYYGMARFTLSWDPVPGVDGYTVYRSSGAALFDIDQMNRRQQKGVYQDDRVFDDDPDFDGWLAAYDPSLTETAMKADPDAHMDAWRAWAKQFYGTRTDQQIQTLANHEVNQEAFRSLNREAMDHTSYDDSFDGRGRGFYVYRIRTVDSAGNQSTWSDTFPPVHIYDVTPPATPKLTSVNGGEKYAVLRWNANQEKDLKEYRIWRDADANRLADVRRLPVTATIQPDGEPTVVFSDDGIAGMQTWYYRIAAVDTYGNMSPPTPVMSARVADSMPPNPPVCERSEWIRLDSSGNEYPYNDPNAQALSPAVALTWLADQPVAEAIVERKGQYDQFWVSIATVDEVVDDSDPDTEDARRYSFFDLEASSLMSYTFRIRLKDLAGKINTKAFNIVSVAPKKGE
jgi:hypothetical protein